MSKWTHVNGSIRIDHMKGIMPDLNFEKIIGIKCLWEDNKDQWDKCNIPCGSEGSLDYTVWTNPDESALGCYTVNIFGDLRDYESVEEIEEWLNKITSSITMIRDMVISVNVETHDKYHVFTYQNGVKKTTIKKEQ